MNEDMEKLINLQRIDSEIAGFVQAIAKCEADTVKREQAILDEQEKLAALKAKITLLTEKQQENQSEHEEAEARMKDSQNKMLLVQTSREHQALLKEIEDNKKLAKSTEERALQFIEQLDQLNKEVAALEAQCEAEQAQLAEVKQKAAKEIKRLNAGKKSVEGERAEKAAAVSPKLLQRYDKLMLKRHGLAVVAVKDSVCMGCHMTLPPQQVNEVLKGDKLNLCPTCQRILYYYAEPEEEAECGTPEAAGEALAPEEVPLAEE